MTSAETSPTRLVLARGSIYSVASAAQLASAVVALPLLTRQLEPSAVGVISAALVVYPVAAHIAGLGLPAAVARPIYDRAPTGASDARSLLLATVVIASGVLLVIHLAGPTWVRAFADIEYEGAVAWAILAALGLVSFFSVQQVLRAEDLAAWYVASAAVAAIGGQAVGVVMVILQGGPDGYLLGLGIGFLAGAAVGAVPIGFTGLRWPSPKLLRSSLRLGGPTVPHLLALLVMSLGDRLVVERVEGLDSVGEYHVAYTAGAPGIVVLSAVNNAWAPQIYASEESERWRVLAATTRDLYPLAGLIAAGIAIAAPLALRVMAPAEYEVATLAPVSGMVALSILPYLRYLSRVHVVFQVRRTGILAAASPAAAALNLALNFVLVPPFGLMGAAASTLVSYATLSVLVGSVARRSASVPWERRSESWTWGLTVVMVIVAMLSPVDGHWFWVRSSTGVLLLVVLLVRGRQLATGMPATPPFRKLDRRAR